MLIAQYAGMAKKYRPKGENLPAVTPMTGPGIETNPKKRTAFQVGKLVRIASLISTESKESDFKS
jgi:hypothetical protein